MRGTISAAGFPTGDRFVIGCWEQSPIGPLVDVMWGTPAGERVLLAPSPDAVEFITSIYEFDDVRVVETLTGRSDGKHTWVTAPELDLELELFGGRRRPVPITRPLAVTRWIERPIARALMGVETFGTSHHGAVEWYQTRGWRWVESGHAFLSGHDLGTPGTVTPPLQVGFSEPPPRPSIVQVHVTIDLPARLALASQGSALL